MVCYVSLSIFFLLISIYSKVTGCLKLYQMPRIVFLSIEKKCKDLYIFAMHIHLRFEFVVICRGQKFHEELKKKEMHDVTALLCKKYSLNSILFKVVILKTIDTDILLPFGCHRS